MAKPTKPEWAYGDPSYVIEPGAAKKETGWESAEKPPFQYMNWIHAQTEEWIEYLENITETRGPFMLVSSGTATWNGATLTLAADTDLSFRKPTGEQRNRLPAGAYALTDGQVLVVFLNRTGASPVALASDTYGTLGAGEYAIVAESSLTEANWENEVVLFRRRGTDLEIAINGEIYPNGATIDFGSSSVGAHSHAASDITSGTFADARVAESNVTQHQAALSIAETQIPDGSILARVAGTEAISGVWTFPSLSGTPVANGTYRQGLAKAWACFSGTTLQASMNVVSITGAGVVTLDRDFATANYAILLCGDENESGTGTDSQPIVEGRAAGGFNFHDSGGGSPTGGYFACFGDQ